MQSIFETYLKLGFYHISDINAYDHIVFIVALCAIYKWNEWKQVAILVTAFTIGHSLTLALSVLDILRFRQDVIEFLIPITIMLTALFNVFQKSSAPKKINLNYLIALLFGFIHGMGFSNYFRQTSMPGQEHHIISQLFAFNIGIELGQLLIVAFILLLSYVVLHLLKIAQRDWTLFVSGIAFGIALTLLL